VISDIDPVFTIGEMAMKRQMIIKRLENEGIFSMNREIELPVLIQRIAVISSKNSAGYSDFINHLKENRAGYVFYNVLFEAAMQGTETEEAIISALNRIAEKREFFDIVVIIRGGGSLTDLSWFDNYNIAYFVTQFPLPVVTGIGHERDLSVTDMVANTSLKTPTAVADFLIEHMTEAEENLNYLSSEISESSLKVLEIFRNRIESSRVKLAPASGSFMSGRKDILSARLLDVVNIGKEYIIRAGLIPEKHISQLHSSVKMYNSIRKNSLEIHKSKLASITHNTLNNYIVKTEALKNSLVMLDPENVLRRGYSITSVNGRIVKNTSEINKDDILETQFIDGTIRSTVIEKNRKKDTK